MAPTFHTPPLFVFYVCVLLMEVVVVMMGEGRFSA